MKEDCKKHLIDIMKLDEELGIYEEEIHSMDDEVECNMCGNIMSLLEDESIYVCFNSECTRCYEEYEEEPKQETLTNDTDSHSWVFENFEVIKTEEDAKIFVETMENIPEPNDKLKRAFRDFKKQETLEEAAENNLTYWKGFSGIGLPNAINSDRIKKSFKAGAKWQQERSYSEEDMKLAFEAGHKKGFSGYPNTENWKELPFDEWFEQFKKK